MAEYIVISETLVSSRYGKDFFSHEISKKNKMKIAGDLFTVIRLLTAVELPQFLYQYLLNVYTFPMLRLIKHLNPVERPG